MQIIIGGIIGKVPDGTSYVGILFKVSLLAPVGIKVQNINPQRPALSAAKTKVLVKITTGTPPAAT
jgi:hypothetical protein